MVSSFEFPAQFARKFPPLKEASTELSNVETHVLRVRARDVPSGLPRDANPREPNTNRQVYRQVRDSLLGVDGTGTGSFHLKHSGIVLVADRVEKIRDDLYRVSFDEGDGKGVVNGGHSYDLIEEINAADRSDIPVDQYVEFKIHVGVPVDAVPDVANGLNNSMQVKPESLADLKGMFDWLKNSLALVPGGLEQVAWHEGDDGEYDVREVVALLMSLDESRYPMENPAGIENTYARLSSVFKHFLADVDSSEPRVQKFGGIAVEAMKLYESIRYEAVDLFPGKFRSTLLDENYRRGEGSSRKTFPSRFLTDEGGRPVSTNARLVKPAAIAIFTAFRSVVEIDSATGSAVWRYPFDEVLEVWRSNAGEMLRDFHESLTSQYRGNLHYAGRSPIVYKSSARILEVADLRKRLADVGR